MKKSLFFVDKELLKDLFEKLICEWTVLAIDVKKLLTEVFEILILSLNVNQSKHFQVVLKSYLS